MNEEIKFNSRMKIDIKNIYGNQNNFFLENKEQIND